jgi:hypothetical protein
MSFIDRSDIGPKRGVRTFCDRWGKNLNLVGRAHDCRPPAIAPTPSPNAQPSPNAASPNKHAATEPTLDGGATFVDRRVPQRPMASEAPRAAS